MSGHARRYALAGAAGAVLLALTVVHTPGSAAGSAEASTPTGVQPTATTTPIKHVVVIFQENHSFDNVLGLFCRRHHRCDGATGGTLANGSTVPLTRATDIIPDVGHSTNAQQTAIDGGRMDGFSNVSGCTQANDLACYSQFAKAQIPNLWALANQYAVSDRTFEMDRILSFGAHLELASSDLDGFAGDIPSKPSYVPKAQGGWGCDSYKVTPWRPDPGAAYQDVPPCVPYLDGTGTWWDSGGPNGTPQTSPVSHITNVFDVLEQAGHTWSVYNQFPAFDICSYFATCDHSVQHQHVYPSRRVVTDATQGTLADLSLVLPDTNQQTGNASQHNGSSMLVGDNWIGDVVRAVQNGPDWSSTAIFITYDDCGCFYDHVPPPDARSGIRLPMVIVSPWAKPRYTDSTSVSFAGMLSFTEHVFGLPPMTDTDASSYDYMGAFDFTGQPHLQTTKLVESTVPARSLRLARQNLEEFDPDDPDDAT